MKRILYIESGVTGGGSFASLLLNIEYIDRRKYTPVVVFLNETSHKRKAEALGVATYLVGHVLYGPRRCYRRRVCGYILRMTARYAPVLYLTVYSMVHRRLILTLRRIVSHHRIDIIHLNNNVVRDLFGVLVSKKAGVSCISHLRGGPDHQPPAKYINALCADVVSAYIAISGHMQQRWARYGIDQRKCHIVYNGIPSLDIKALNVRREFRLGPVKTVICSVGRLAAWKNHSFLMRGFAEYRNHNPSSALLIVGDGPERSRLERISQELNIARHVILVGHSEQAQEILAGADIFVLPSKQEPFGRVTLEAMALEIPVIATRSGGSAEVVTDNRTGLLVSLDNVQEMCNALKALSDNRELRERLIRNAYESTRNEFHVKNCVTAIENIYENI